jgi:hypothetical protein
VLTAVINSIYLFLMKVSKLKENIKTRNSYHILDTYVLLQEGQNKLPEKNKIVK